MCFMWMLHIFCNGFSSIFRCFYKCFRCMLQAFQLFPTYVVNVSFDCFKSRLSVASPSSPSDTYASVSPPLFDTSDVWTVWAHVGAGGMGGADRSSSVRSERTGHAAHSRRRKLCPDVSLGPDVRALVA
jgi:hypothetical protein